eukprot:TRINITY_DN12410_c0_g1_i1.p1 TRINITY_DN12410_c0_g1~~TRINITY_DN12410_c0_g1_i1.p1  ORF type:complete len:215 (+),score=58.69 TRINITY_DN12410_c0_g1_i1:1-645(+)
MNNFNNFNNRENNNNKRPCKYWLSGNCKNGKTCSFFHPQTTEQCKYVTLEKCKNHNCRYLHKTKKQNVQMDLNNKDNLKMKIQHDVDDFLDKHYYLLTTYGPEDRESVIKGDHSAEELRLSAIVAHHKSMLDKYKEHEDTIKKTNLNKFQLLKSNPLIFDNNSSITQNPFNFNTNNNNIGGMFNQTSSNTFDFNNNNKNIQLDSIPVNFRNQFI